jgi:hypothetical protein
VTVEEILAKIMCMWNLLSFTWGQPVI